MLAEPLTLSVGASFQRFQKQFPAAHTEAANAVTTTLRYARRLEDSEGNKHELDAGYSLRAATRTLRLGLRLRPPRGGGELRLQTGSPGREVKFTGGQRIRATPPLFERFVLGNAPRSAAGTSSTWRRSAARAWRTVRWSTATTGSRFSTTRARSGTSEQSGETKHSLGVGYRRAGTGSSWRWPSR